MKLKKKIQNSMILVVLTSLILTYGTMIFVVYYQTMEILKNEIQQEADYIEAAVCISGVSYLEDMDAVRENTRVTLIDASGEVLYDSGKQEEHLENHLDRPEIQEALKSGSGQDVRRSETLDQDMFYYAVRLDNGTVLRVSKNMETVFSTAMSILPMMGVVACCMVIFALLLAKWQTAKLIYPINHLNLAEPLENDMYEELTPLLQSIDKQNREKDAVANMRKEFSANVSHELKTPLALIQGYAEGLKECINDDAQSRDFYCEVIMDEADKMNQMVKKLLTLNQLESGNETITMERFDVTELIRGVLHSVDILIGQSGITVTECPAEPIYVWADEFMTEEVVTNYLSNAIHYAGGKKEISIRCREQEKNVRISVFNTGDPIPEEDIDKIWSKFYKVDKARTREYGGSGIGLSIVKAIMDSFHQQCGVINHEDGVEFWFELEKGKQS